MRGKHSGVKSTCNQNYLSIFIQRNIMGFFQDCSVTLIDETDGSDHTIREEYWRVVLKTLATYGLNRFLTYIQEFMHSFEIKA